MYSINIHLDSSNTGPQDIWEVTIKKNEIDVGFKFFNKREHAECWVNGFMWALELEGVEK